MKAIVYTKYGAPEVLQLKAVGSGARQFKPGDAVFGEVFGRQLGGFGEYVTAAESDLGLKPANLSYEEAAAVPLAAKTALQGLNDLGQIQAGQKVLIIGASGGVGTFALQLAKYFGTEVTAVCSTRNAEMARRLGADHVIDYTKEDFIQNGLRYDLILAVRLPSDLGLPACLEPQGSLCHDRGSFVPNVRGDAPGTSDV